MENAAIPAMDQWPRGVMNHSGSFSEAGSVSPLAKEIALIGLLALDRGGGIVLVRVHVILKYLFFVIHGVFPLLIQERV